MFSLTAIADQLRNLGAEGRHDDAGYSPTAPANERLNWLDQLPEAVLVSREGRIRYANQYACELFLAGTKKALHRLPLAQLLPEPQSSADKRPAHRLNGEQFYAAIKTQAITLNGYSASLHVVRNIEYEHGLEQRLERKQDSVVQLSGRLIETQERERRHIARELHDEIGQCLSAIRVQFAKLQRRVQTPESLHLIESAAALTERTLSRVRSLSLLLHPPQLETLGLRAALRWHLREQEHLHDWHIHFEEDELDYKVHPDLAIAVYRIVQESLSNARRHGNARNVTVRLAGDHHTLVVDVMDDGCGFNTDDSFLDDRPSLGLIGMTERARLLRGKLTVTSAAGRGTHISATFPRDEGRQT